MTKQYQKLLAARNYIQTETDIIPETAIVLGSGLNRLCASIDIKHTINYSKMQDFPICTNEMHNGRFIFGYIGSVPVVAMDGRLHYYEGYSMDEVVMPVRLMRMLGAKTLILSNAVGGISDFLNIGDLMLITDHISSFVPSPLCGENISELGTRFPDMTNVYDKNLRQNILELAQKLNINLKTGIFVQTCGPNYETPAEVKMFRNLGADAVGMSTACEAIAAVHCGFKVCAISCITNKAAGITGQTLNDEDVGIIASKSSDKFCRLVKEIVLLTKDE